MKTASRTKTQPATTGSAATRWTALIYAAICYLSFHAAFVWLVLFLNNVGPLPTIDDGAPRHWLIAIVINFSLVLLFGLQHSVMARQSFKRVWTKIIPASTERATYVLATVLCLVVAYVWWSPMPTEIWRFDHPAVVFFILGIQALGWAILVASTFALNHFHLFGLTQAWSAFRQRSIPELEFRTPWIYRVVRHPIQLGVLIGIWATPVMTVGHYVFSTAMTIYVFVGLYFEERDLIRQFGERYLAYRQNVPKVLPRLWPTKLRSSRRSHKARHA